MNGTRQSRPTRRSPTSDNQTDRRSIWLKWPIYACISYAILAFLRIGILTHQSHFSHFIGVNVPIVLLLILLPVLLILLVTYLIKRWSGAIFVLVLLICDAILAIRIIRRNDWTYTSADPAPASTELVSAVQ